MRDQRLDIAGVGDQPREAILKEVVWPSTRGAGHGSWYSSDGAPEFVRAPGDGH